MNSTIFLRAHTEILQKTKKRKRQKQDLPEPIWSPCALVFDCETRIDEKQCLTFGPYRIVFADETGEYSNIREEGFFYEPQEITPQETCELQKFANHHNAETAHDVSNELRIRTREEFLKEIFFPLAVNGALIVGFNLPFDIARLAADAREARRLNDDWSFVMLNEPFCPRIVVQSS